MSVFADRRVKAALIVAGVVLAAFHVRAARRAAAALPESIVPPGEGLRAVLLQIRRHDATLQHALRIAWDTRASSGRLVFANGQPTFRSAPWAETLRGELVPLDIKGDRRELRVDFPLPPPDEGGFRVVVVRFTTDLPEVTYGWGYRAVSLPWVAALAPRTVTAQVEVKAEHGAAPSGWRCTEIVDAGRVCATELRTRKVVAVPVASHDDLGKRIGFAVALGITISTLMYAVYRRWASLASQMGLRDDVPAPTLDELVAEYRRAPRARRSESTNDQGDPFEAVALVARGIAAVLGVVGSIFLVSHFSGGLFPFEAPLALATWTAVAGLTVIVAVGIDRPRAWAALAVVVALLGLAFHPFARWALPGLAPIAAACLMQVTAKP